MKKYEYLSTELGCSGKLFLRGADGSPDKWHRDYVDSTSYRASTELKDDKKSLRVTDGEPSNCRETVCNSFSAFFREDLNKVPADSLLCLEAPPGVKDTLELSFRLLGPDKSIAGHFHEDYCTEFTSDLYSDIFKLATTKEQQEQLFILMDYVLGCTGMLIGGPKAFTRYSANPVEKATTRKETADSYVEETGGYDTTEFKIATCYLRYNGLSNEMLRRPEHLSLVLGLGRFCIELYLEGKYGAIDKRVNLKKSIAHLKRIRRRKALNNEDVRTLLRYLLKLKRYWKTDKVHANLGAYPLNEYTWGMFRKYVNENQTSSIIKYWLGANLYGHNDDYGFYGWCKKHKNPTKKFAERPKRKNWNWSGTNGILVYS